LPPTCEKRLGPDQVQRDRPAELTVTVLELRLMKITTPSGYEMGLPRGRDRLPEGAVAVSIRAAADPRQ